MKRFFDKTSLFYLNLMFTLFLFSSSVVAAENWERLFPNYPTHGFNDIYSESADNVFAIGNYGLIYHYNGSAWSEMESPVAVDLNAIWGRAANDVFAVGNDGIIIWYNGSVWKEMNSPTSVNLHCVWGFDEIGSQVYAGGRNGNILVYSGGNWAYMDTFLPDGIWGYSIIHDIWGESPSNLYAVGWGQDSNSTIFNICLSNSGGNTWVKEEEEGLCGGATFRPVTVEGFSGQDVYIGGAGGVYRLNDGNWSTSEQVFNSSINDIWGASHSSMRFVSHNVNFNGITHYNGETSVVLSTTTVASGSKIYGNSDTDIFVVTGADGEILHYQGEAWSSMTTVPKNLPVHSVCGISSDSLYAVGDNGMILYFDGEYWAPMESATNENLYSVCGSGNAVFAVGDSGTVLFYNGSKWSRVNSGTTKSLYDAWCHSSTDAFVVGANGTVLNCSGSLCSPQSTDGTTNHLFAVYHSDLGPYAAGENGVVLHKDGTNIWNKVASVPRSQTITDLWGDPSFGLVAVGGEYIHSYNTNTNTWTEEYKHATTLNLQAITGAEVSDLYVVGYGGTYPYDGIVLHNNGSWGEIKNLPGQYLSSIWQVSGDLFIGSMPQDLVTSPWSGSIFRYDGSKWSGMIENRALQDIWGTATDNLFAVGDTGAILHYNGSIWSSMDSGVTTYLDSVYVAENGQWAVAGGFGVPDKMIRYNGSSWSPVSIPVEESISDLWGSGDKVYAAVRGAVLSSGDSGVNWLAEPTPAGTGYLNAIWGAGLNGPLFAAGDDAVLLTSSGDGNWSNMQSNALSHLDLKGVWGSSGDDVYAVGHSYEMLGSNESQIVHFDGTSWKSVYYSYNVLPAQYLNDIWGRSQADVFAFGSQGLRNDDCSSGWETVNVPGVPSLESVWGMEGIGGTYYLFAVADNGHAIYRNIISADRRCASSWSLFLPAILSGNK